MSVELLSVETVRKRWQMLKVFLQNFKGHETSLEVKKSVPNNKHEDRLITTGPEV